MNCLVKVLSILGLVDMFPSSWSSLSRFFSILEIASGMIDRSRIGRFRVVIVGLVSSMIGYSTVLMIVTVHSY
jgi:hypothetical protein